MDDLTILKAIGSTEVSTFEEFLAGLEHEVPAKNEKREWWVLFTTLERLQTEGLIEVERAGEKNRIETLILTESGAARVKADKARE